MIITIEGKAGEGKTRQAREMTEFCDVVQIQEHQLKGSFGCMQVDENTDYIIIDDVRDYDFVYNFFNKDTITIVRPNKKDIEIKTPTVIIIKQ